MSPVGWSDSQVEEVKRLLEEEFLPVLPEQESLEEFVVGCQFEQRVKELHHRRPASTPPVTRPSWRLPFLRTPSPAAQVWGRAPRRTGTGCRG